MGQIAAAPRCLCCRLHPAPATTFVCVWFLASPHHCYQAHGLNLDRYTFLPPVQSNCEIKMGAVIELYNTDTQIDPCADIGGYLNGGDTEPSPSFQIDCRHQFCQRNFAKFQDHCLLNALDRLESIHHKSKVKVNHQQAALRIFAKTLKPNCPSVINFWTNVPISCLLNVFK